MKNIGFVQYQKGSESGTLKAKWCFGDKEVGTGFATGGSKEGYEGNYTVRYFDQDGHFQVELELIITKHDLLYHLSWLNNGIVTSKGIGMENSDGLAAGYQDV